MLDISVTLSKNLKQKPADESALGFGRIFTDHMFMMDYELGLGWHNARIVPYGTLAMDPAAMVLHYGQAISRAASVTAGRTADCSFSGRWTTWPV